MLVEVSDAVVASVSVLVLVAINVAINVALTVAINVAIDYHYQTGYWFLLSYAEISENDVQQFLHIHSTCDSPQLLHRKPSISRSIVKFMCSIIIIIMSNFGRERRLKDKLCHSDKKIRL